MAAVNPATSSLVLLGYSEMSSNVEVATRNTAEGISA
jgi:hypothetical protein